jgi:shikimate dehydrogenase
VACVIGDPVAHSRSPAMHEAAYRELRLPWRYVALRVEPSHLEAALEGLSALGFRGVNVTVPHKVAAAARCATLTAEARAAGAVNTLLPGQGGWHGALTDGLALAQAVGEEAPAVLERPALVLGAGGAARAAVTALVTAGVPRVAVQARRAEAARALAEAVGGPVEAVDRAPADIGLVVNATPAGGLVALEEPGLPADALERRDVLADYAYRPDGRPTAAVAGARAAGRPVVDGLELLARQGALAFTLMTGEPAPLDVMRRAAREGTPA